MLPIPFNNMIGVISSSSSEVKKPKTIFPPANTYGLLYNHPAAVHSLLPINSNFRVPTESEVNHLISAVGGEFNHAHKVKDTRQAPLITTPPRWHDPYPQNFVSPTNELNFHALPAGKNHLGNYMDEGTNFCMWTSSKAEDELFAMYLIINNVSNAFWVQSEFATSFASIRLVRNVSIHEVSLPNGTILPDHLIDIDGNSYELVKIGYLIWTVQNLKVTRLRDGTPIFKREPDTGKSDDPEYRVIYNDDSYT